jgi:hypothetical protein
LLDGGGEKSVLLLGLIGIVGLLLLAYSFKLSLVFLVVLGASLLTRVSLRKLLLGLQRGKQESGIVNTFWGLTTLFLISVFSLIPFIYFEEELSRLPTLKSLGHTILWVVAISLLVGLFILVFLRSKTGFPRWTVALAAVLFGLAGLVSIVWFITPGGPSAPLQYPRFPREAFDVSYRAKITFQGKVLRVQEEYEIQPKSHYLFVSIDDEWLSRNPSVSIGPLRWFEAKESTGALPGLFVTVDREIGAHITELGLLRRKLELYAWRDLRIRVKNLTKTPPPEEEADSKAGISTFPLGLISTTSGKVEVRLPKNSYLGSFPEGKLLKLPDRDQLVLNWSNFSDHAYRCADPDFYCLASNPELELYYLAWLRLGIVRTLLSDSSVPDIVLKTIAFIFWPVALLALGATQRSLGDSLVRVIQRKPQRRRAGF